MFVFDNPYALGVLLLSVIKAGHILDNETIFIYNLKQDEKFTVVQ